MKLFAKIIAIIKGNVWKIQKPNKVKFFKKDYCSCYENYLGNDCQITGISLSETKYEKQIQPFD